MKGLKFICGISSLTVIALVLVAWNEVSQNNKKIPARRSGTAIILTGAAARIPQEAALLEELYNRGLLKNVVFISGVSSGALNSVVLN